MPRCKPGDLAIIVKVKHLQELLGRIVRVIERCESYEHTVWVVECASGEEIPVFLSEGKVINAKTRPIETTASYPSKTKKVTTKP